MKSWTKPTSEQVAKAVTSLSRKEQQRYFFDKLQNPAWITALREKGFFSNPPATERNDAEGTIRFVPWPQSQYLARMAGFAPSEVADIFLSLPSTDNIYVHEDLLSAATQMSAEWASKLADVEARWIESQQWLYGLYADRCTKLVGHLLSNPQTRESGITLATALLMLKKGGGEFIKKAQGKFDEYGYSQAIRTLALPFVDALGIGAVNFFADILNVALDFEGEKAPEDYSYIWRPAIEDHEQNELHAHEIPSVLISTIRDAANEAIGREPQHAEAVIKGLLGRRWRIFRRIAYFLAQKRLNKTSSLLPRMLIDRKAIEDTGLQHEYCDLLRSQYAALSARDKRGLLDLMREGPSYLTKEDDRREIRLAHWQSSRLHLIREHLMGDDLAMYSRLVEKYGEPHPVGFPYSVGGGWVGPTSPAAKEDLERKKDEELLRYLMEWEPDGGMMSPSRMGLARQVEALITDQPTRLWSLGDRLRNLNPTYVGAIFNGLAAAAGKNASFDWKAPLELGEWVTKQPFDEEKGGSWDEGDSSWSNSRRAVARVAAAGVQSKGNPIPIESRALAWRALYPVTDDPDPTPAHEAQYGGTNMGPTMLALNSNRGEAMNAVIQYALWVRRSSDVDGSWKGFDTVPEVRDVLNRHLDRSLEPSTAIRSIYGQWFPWLHLLDKDWASKNKGTVFPKEDEATLFWEVAWKTYITHVRPYDEMLEVLRADYARAIETLGKHVYKTNYIADPDERLAEHLIVFLVRGKLEFDDPLITKLYEIASPALRKHIINFLGRSLWGDEEVSPRIHARMRSLWQRRLTASTPPADPTELKAFGAWFSAKQEDPAWVLPELVKALRIEPDIDLEFMVLKQLANVATGMPGAAAEALHLIVTGTSEHWRIGLEADAIRAILVAALKGDARAREIAVDTIEHFGKSGMHTFRDLLPKLV